VKSWHVFFALPFFTALGINSKADSPHDFKSNKDLGHTIVSELEAGQLDLLENQYQDFQGQTLGDGTSKFWVYFDAFFTKTSFAGSLQEATSFTKKARQWLRERPDSVPAVLALLECLLGECQYLRKSFLLGTAPKNPEQIETRGAEIDSLLRTFPAQDALVASPQYYSTTVQFFPLMAADYKIFQGLEHDLMHIDPYFAPFYIGSISWLKSKRQKDTSFPRAEIWLLDHLKPTALDSDEEKAKKCRTYAQVLAFDMDKDQPLDGTLLDWPTLKAGLQSFIQIYGSETDWPSRLLAYSWQFKDKEAAKEALSIIQGNYSGEIFTDPTAFQQLGQWVESEEN
jgi:hypothetical protein